AASKEDTAAIRRELNRSLSKRIALRHVPTTNPSCTAMVSQALVLGWVRHSAIIAGAVTVALNQGVMPRIMAQARRRSWLRAPGAVLRCFTQRRALRDRRCPDLRGLLVPSRCTQRGFGWQERPARPSRSSEQLSRHHSHTHEAVDREHTT